ncbi:MerR family transcriptional regulator [Sphingobium sp. RSMS]|uniref:MerR family transcriptional regulator n=1 Tax=Sphingobium sp. RSMS TaxID=520734 RepID=UPI0010F9E5AE|nr:MerR family transcriptional regulator [Sphingobium sp. RSMS]
MKIGDLAKATGVSIQTIRLYEREGLIEIAARSSGKFRLFAAEHEVRLRFIKRLRELGFSLDDVRDLLMFSAGRSTDGPIRSLERIKEEAEARRASLTKLIEGLASVCLGEAPPDLIERVFEIKPHSCCEK